MDGAPDETLLIERLSEEHATVRATSPTRLKIGDRVRVFNARGEYFLRARVNGKPRCGVVVAPSVWWKKHAPDGRNANNVTSQRVADLGGGATFYDCRVEVELVDRVPA